jgi:hypothetical protein
VTDQRIMWKARRGRQEGWDGLVNGMVLFRIRVPRPDASHPWMMKTRLPLVDPGCTWGPEELLKARAEFTLTHFVGRLGAQWKPSGL